jgi:hypothetical protein
VADIIEKYAFQYTYDHRGRGITKKVPGIKGSTANGEVNIVYDMLDHLTLQPAHHGQVALYPL